MQKAWSIIKSLVRHDEPRQAGFSAVEVLLAASVFGILVMGLVGSLIYGRASIAGAGDHARANFLADEGIQATRNIGGAAFSNLTNGTFGLAKTGSQWTFSGSSDITGIYTRTVTISTSGTNRKSIVSTVTWPQPGGTTGNVTLTSMLANWQANTSAPKSWSNAIIAGSIFNSSNGIKTTSVGNYAYTVLNSDTFQNFTITDVSNPAAPVTKSIFTLNGAPTNIFVSGNYAYITTSSLTGQLQIVDISNPSSPVLKSHVSMPDSGFGQGQGIFVSGNYAYVGRSSDNAVGSKELTVVNVSVPTAPVIVGGYSTGGTDVNEVYVSGNYAYLATGSATQQLTVINITNPLVPTLAATYNSPTSDVGLAVTGFGNTVFIGVGMTLNAVDVTTPTSPKALGSFTAAGFVNDIAVDSTNKFAFLGTDGATGQFQVVNVANTSALSLTKSVVVPGAPSDLNGVAYNSSLDLAVGASISSTETVIVFTKN